MTATTKPRSNEHLRTEMGFNDHYPKVVGDSPFAKAVNKKMSNYWVKTGHVMPLETAGFSVLADLYNDLANGLSIEDALKAIE